MRIALYYPWIYLRSGVERTILELTRKSNHQWTIFTSHFDPDSTYPEFKERKIIELSRVSVKRSFKSVFIAAMKILRQKLDLEDFDFLLIFSEGLGDLITFRNHKIPVICYCWTPLKVVHDPYARGEYFKNNRFKKPVFLLSSLIFKLIDRFAWRHYRYVFCCSNEVKKRIIKARLASPEHIEVLYPGVDVQKIQPRWEYQPYFFHPTRIKWWKNVGLSIEAFKEFQNRFSNFDRFGLIIAGQVDKGSKIYYQRLLDMSKENKSIQIIPNPSEDEFSGLYKNCYLVLNTTFNEDWGLVPLEAMACGKPVIAVNQGGPKESIIDGKTGFLVEPSAKGFAGAMRALAEDKDLVSEMGKEARRHSLRYDWSNFITRIDAYIDSIET